MICAPSDLCQHQYELGYCLGEIKVSSIGNETYMVVNKTGGSLAAQFKLSGSRNNKFYARSIDGLSATSISSFSSDSLKGTLIVQGNEFDLICVE